MLQLAQHAYISLYGRHSKLVTCRAEAKGNKFFVELDLLIKMLDQIAQPYYVLVSFAFRQLVEDTFKNGIVRSLPCAP